jgi:hypothetical protein
VLERALTELFGQQAGEEPPTIRASIPEAVRSGRKHGRRRRAVIVAAPLLAAVAVLGIAVTTAPSHPAPARPAHHGKPSHALAQAPPEFNPLVPYVSFGWLPDGATATQITDSRSVVFLDAAGPLKANWQVSVFARGDCSLRQATLACRDLTSLQYPMTTQQAPSIDGFPAYWDDVPGILIFEYARGGWATLTLYGTDGQADSTEAATAVHIAQTLRFGAPTGPVLFPAQVTGLPPGWAIRSVQFSYSTQGPLARSYQIAAGALLAAPWYDATDILAVTISPASQPPASCPITPGQSQQTTVGNYPVTILQIPAGQEPAEQSLCAADADGLAVSIVTSGNQPPISVSQLFTQIRVLGPDPARWTTSPIS